MPSYSAEIILTRAAMPAKRKQEAMTAAMPALLWALRIMGDSTR